MPADRTVTGRRRERRTVENREFDAFARRIVRAYARRVADGDVEALVALRQLSSVLEDATKDAVAGLRQFGYSWAEIAARLGLSHGTVRNYLSDAIGKLGVGNRIEAYRLAREKGWL